MESAEGLDQLLREWAVPLESESGRQLTEYLGLLEKWNVRINLTSTTEWRVIGPLFREGIWAAKLYPDEATSHLDIGSGAGFPAILLKILNPRIELDMVESREKKGRFLETVIDRLGLRSVRIHTASLADYLRSSPESACWNCVSWKAIKLRAKDLLRLHARGLQNAQFWMFHGIEVSWEETAAIRQRFELVRKEKVPGMRKWHLSIYRAV